MDTNLLLRSFIDCHHDPCDNIQVEVSAMSTLFEKFIARFSESKVNLFISAFLLVLFDHSYDLWDMGLVFVVWSKNNKLYFQ